MRNQATIMNDVQHQDTDDTISPVYKATYQARGHSNPNHVHSTLVTLIIIKFPMISEVPTHVWTGRPDNERGVGEGGAQPNEDVIQPGASLHVCSKGGIGGVLDPNFSLHFVVSINIHIRATSHIRLRARDHYSSSTLIGGKGGVVPSSLHTTLEGPTEYVNPRWM